MAETTIKVACNVPPELWQKLREQASRNRRSINAELAMILDAALSTTKH